MSDSWTTTYAVRLTGSDRPSTAPVRSTSSPPPRTRSSRPSSRRDRVRVAGQPGRRTCGRAPRGAPRATPCWSPGSPRGSRAPWPGPGPARAARRPACIAITARPCPTPSCRSCAIRSRSSVAARWVLVAARVLAGAQRGGRPRRPPPRSRCCRALPRGSRCRCRRTPQARPASAGADESTATAAGQTQSRTRDDQAATRVTAGSGQVDRAVGVAEREVASRSAAPLADQRGRRADPQERRQHGDRLPGARRRSPAASCAASRLVAAVPRSTTTAPSTARSRDGRCDGSAGSRRRG